MARPQQPKVTNAPATAEPWWAFPISIRETADGSHLQIAWRRLAVLLTLTALLAWFSLVGGIFLWLKFYRGFSDVRIGYIAIPTRWSEYSTARGNFYIKQAKREIADQKLRDALHHLRVGVAASPSNTEGRLYLAQFYTLLNRIELAQSTLVQGVPYAKDDVEYLKPLFGFLLQYQEDNEVIRLASELLPQHPVVNNRNQLIAIAATTANLFRGNYDTAESLMKEYALSQTKDGRLLAARVEWESGHRDTALARLRLYSHEYPSEEEYYTLLVSYHRELGQYAEVEKYALMRELASPNSAAARVDLLQDYKRNHNTEMFERTVDSILRDFADNPTALSTLVNFASTNGEPAIALRVYQHLLQHNLETDAAAILVAESYIVAGDHNAALDFLGEVGRARPEWLEKFRSNITGLQAVAYYGLGRREECDLYLEHLLKTPNLRTVNLTAIASRLMAVGAKEQARKVLAQTVATNPRNQAALTLLIELDLERAPSDELIVNLRRLLTMRRPSQKILQAAHTRLSSDRFFFIDGRNEVLATIQSMLDLSPVVSAKQS
jgi:tetratricopeptide (TPR) repeat protein